MVRSCGLVSIYRFYCESSNSELSMELFRVLVEVMRAHIKGTEGA